jgi:hypothetical protein
MAFRKTGDIAEHDQPVETDVEGEIRSVSFYLIAFPAISNMSADLLALADEVIE